MTIENAETVAAHAFKAHFLELLDRVQASGLSITITKHGKPVARLVPMPAQAAPFYGSLPVTIVGDIVCRDGESWDAEH